MPVKDKRGTDFIIPFSFCAKNGRKRNVRVLRSRSPNNKSQKCFSFCLVFSSAIVSNSSFESSSSTVMLKNFAIAFKDSIFGYPLPVSRT